MTSIEDRTTPWRIRPHAKTLAQEMPSNGLLIPRALSPLPRVDDGESAISDKECPVLEPRPRRRRRERSRSPRRAAPVSRSRSRSRSRSPAPDRLALQLLKQAPHTTASSEALVELLGRDDATRAVGTLARQGKIEVDPAPHLAGQGGVRIRLLPSAVAADDKEEPLGCLAAPSPGTPLWSSLWRGKLILPPPLPFCVQIEQATWRPPSHGRLWWTTSTCDVLQLDLGRSMLRLSKHDRPSWTTFSLALAWRTTTEAKWTVPEKKACARNQPIWKPLFCGQLDPSKAEGLIVSLSSPVVNSDALPWKRGQKLQSVEMDFGLAQCRVVLLDQTLHVLHLKLVFYE